MRKKLCESTYSDSKWIRDGKENSSGNNIQQGIPNYNREFQIVYFSLILSFQS